jgi:putative tricarboxylic transport membrane protein
MPGGIGAVAWHTLVSQRASEPNTLVAFSGGSLLNLAQGKFGKAKPSTCAGWRRWARTTA